MHERNTFVETEILKILKAKHPALVFTFDINGVRDPELMNALNTLLAKGLVEGTVQHTGYDMNIRRPTPFQLTEYGVEQVNSLRP